MIARSSLRKFSSRRLSRIPMLRRPNKNTSPDILSGEVFLFSISVEQDEQRVAGSGVDGGPGVVDRVGYPGAFEG